MLCEQHMENRNSVLNKKRRIIFNNDGCDVLAECNSPDREEFLSKRMNRLAGTSVDAVFCATMGAGFGLFTHNTAAGSILTSKEGGFGKNITGDLIKQGTDHLELVSDFCRNNGIEIFWELRMNDTHDGHNNENAVIAFESNEFKMKHPELLMGKKGKNPPVGKWSAVDYSHEEVRKKAVSFIREVLDNYYVDGINLDFFRHPVFFKSTARGKPASQWEILKMTELIKEIRGLLDEKSMSCRRGLLLSVRVPDSIDYSRAIGLDIAGWMSEGLIDIMVPTSYIRLNDWNYSIDLGHRYGVKVYPSLDETRINDEAGRKLREKVQCYKARAMNALRAGADGIYLFNYEAMNFTGYSEDSDTIFKSIGDIKMLNRESKIYVVSTRGVARIPGGGYPHKKFIRIPVLNPDSPVKISSRQNEDISILIGDDMKLNTKNKIKAEVFLGLRIEKKPNENEIDVLFNKNKLCYVNTEGLYMKYHVPSDIVFEGNNIISTILHKSKKSLFMLKDVAVWIYYE